MRPERFDMVGTLASLLAVPASCVESRIESARGESSDPLDEGWEQWCEHGCCWRETEPEETT